MAELFRSPTHLFHWGTPPTEPGVTHGPETTVAKRWLHLNWPGYLTFLSGRPGYDPDRLLPSAWLQVWESLQLKLKEFELLHAMRRAVVLVERQGGHMIGRERYATRVASSGGVMHLSASTQPLEFMAPWVVDPLVARFGLIYDISDFTETVSLLRRSGTLEQDRSFRMMFRFQRKVNRLATQNRAKLEKYLGDGAFYSSREAHNLLVLAIHIQRAYREALAKGFPFCNGLRIASSSCSYTQARLYRTDQPVQPELQHLHAECLGRAVWLHVHGAIRQAPLRAGPLLTKA